MKLTTDVPLLFLSAVDNNSIFAYFYVTSMDFKKKNYGPFLWIGLNCLKAGGTSRRQFTFSTKFPEIYGTHFIDLGRMKGSVDLGASRWS